MTKRKYRPVRRIFTLAEFEKSHALWFERRTPGCKTIMMHRAALESLQVHTLMVWLQLGRIYECERITGKNENETISE